MNDVEHVDFFPSFTWIVSFLILLVAGFGVGGLVVSPSSIVSTVGLGVGFAKWSSKWDTELHKASNKCMDHP